MFATPALRKGLIALLLALSATSPSYADELAGPDGEDAEGFAARVVDEAPFSASTVGKALDKALDLIGIRYRRGGTSPATGFDCSGFVGHVFKEALGLYLPRDARQISRTGEVVARNELLPGDLVFFNTMRRAFSHVGIYLGDNKFVHAPRSGGAVRVEDLTDSYWRRHFNGARRILQE